LRKVSEVIARTLTCVALIATALGLAKSAVAQTNDQRPRLLIVAESDSRLPLVKRMLQGIEEELGPEFTTRSEIYVEYLDLLRFNDPKELDLNRTFIVERYKGLGLDAIGVFGNNALTFVLEHRDAIAPAAPVVFGAVGDEGLKIALGGRTEPDVSGVISALDFRRTLDLALQVQPDAPEIVIVAGSSVFDRQWRDVVQAGARESYGGKPVRLLAEASADDFLAEARSLDPATIVLLLSVNLDASGRRFLPVQFAEALAAASAAPVWTLYETQVGLGVVGGSVEDVSATGRAMGAMLRTAVMQEPLPAPVRVGDVPTVDWRVMQRHGLDMDLLPEDSRILFYEPSYWERHRALLLAIAAVVAAQTATIIGLLFERGRYLRTQEALASERGKLFHVSRNLRLGQLSASLAHEINQPLAAIQANAEAGVRIAGRTQPDLEEISAIFRDINDDVRRAGSTIANLRRLMVKGEVAMERLDLNDIVRDTLPLARNELAVRGAQVWQALSPDPLLVKGNGPQLQQIVLNLVLNASEAMAELPEAARIVRVTTTPIATGGATLTVEDAGPGLAANLREDAFRPFVSNKPSGLGVGLAICRSIAEAHGGSLAFAEPVGAGARVVLTLPEARAAA
jgi:signal transduction histidine kinase